MSYRQWFFSLRGFGIPVLLLVACSGFGAAQNEVVLHRFQLTDGAGPIGALVADAQRNVYGVTESGGNGDCVTYPMLRSGCGTVFELTPTAGGRWKETTLYQFQGGSDGAFPEAGMIFDQAGNLYGTTFGGGLSQACCGTVFELSPPSQPGGSWSETVIYRFTAYTDGAEPLSRLIFDQLGNLYGTAASGGQDYDCCGTVFELSPPAQTGGSWAETTLHIFHTQPYDGYSPYAGLTFDESGFLYGTTYGGGVSDWGTVFQLTPPKSGRGLWRESFYSFRGGTSDGASPEANLILIRGSLVGTTSAGGPDYSGTIFQVSASPGGITENVLYNFQLGEISGTVDSGLVVDSALNLYGTTGVGGSGDCPSFGCGTVYQLVPPSSPGGTWTENTLYSFQGGSDGTYPYNSPLLLSGKWLVGVTSEGGGSGACNPSGAVGCGTVFAVRK